MLVLSGVCVENEGYDFCLYVWIVFASVLEEDVFSVDSDSQLAQNELQILTFHWFVQCIVSVHY